MSKVPDVAGLPLEEARELCRQLGYEVEIIFTFPVKVVALGRARAVRFTRVSNNKGVLTVVFEVERRGGGQGGIQDN